MTPNPHRHRYRLFRRHHHCRDRHRRCHRRRRRHNRRRRCRGLRHLPGIKELSLFIRNVKLVLGINSRLTTLYSIFSLSHSKRKYRLERQIEIWPTLADVSILLSTFFHPLSNLKVSAFSRSVLRDQGCSLYTNRYLWSLTGPWLLR